MDIYRFVLFFLFFITPKPLFSEKNIAPLFVLFYHSILILSNCDPPFPPNFIHHLSRVHGYDPRDWSNFSRNNSYKMGSIPSLALKKLPSFCWIPIYLPLESYGNLRNHTLSLSYTSFLSHAHEAQCWVESPGSRSHVTLFLAFICYYSHQLCALFILWSFSMHADQYLSPPGDQASVSAERRGKQRPGRIERVQ